MTAADPDQRDDRPEDQPEDRPEDRPAEDGGRRGEGRGEPTGAEEDGDARRSASRSAPRSAAEERAEFGDAVKRKADRRARARRERRYGVWFGLGMFGLVGWAVAIPTLIGIAIGAWLDARYPGGPSWTLTGLVIGIALGSLNAWLWVKRESRHD